MANPQDKLDFALALSEVANQMALSKYKTNNLKIETKPDLTPVTEADTAIEKELRRLIAQSSNEPVLGEEFGQDEVDPDKPHWIIDPIDGTKNFVRGVPVWATLIAYVENNTPIVGVVSAPAMNRTWWAATNLGAFTKNPHNQTSKLEVSKIATIKDASFSYSDNIGWDRYPNGEATLQHLIKSCWRTRAYGDFYSHMLVAEGAIDIAAEPNLAPWDVAALVPIVNEAGGKMTGYDGTSCLTAKAGLTTNGLLHKSVLELLK
jgi:histidinol-phosphatase